MPPPISDKSHGKVVDFGRGGGRAGRNIEMTNSGMGLGRRDNTRRYVCVRSPPLLRERTGRGGREVGQRCPTSVPTGNKPGGNQQREGRNDGDGRGAIKAPWGSSCSTPGGGCWQDPYPTGQSVCQS